MTATYGQTLADIALPNGWEWENAEQSVGNAGTRTAFAVFTPADTENYNSVRVQIAYSVEKAHYDMSGVKFEDAEYAYDGQEKKLEIEGVLPAGVLIAYSENRRTDAGELTFSATAVYTPSDTQNYNTVEMLLTIGVESLSQGAVIGISVGSVLGAVLIAYGLLALLYKKGIVHGTFFAKIYPFIR